MNNTIQDYQSLQRRITDLKEQSARVSGKIDSLKDDLKSRGFTTVDKAVVWLEKAEKEHKELEREIEDALEMADEKMRSL